MENNESNDNIMDRILQGKDLKSEIDKFVVVGPIPGPSPVFNKYFQTGDYAIWNFHFAKTFMGIKFSKIKNLFVNPDFGKEGLHSNNDNLELHCILLQILLISKRSLNLQPYTANVYILITTTIKKLSRL